jgi:hypothetical protein
VKKETAEHLTESMKGKLAQSIGGFRISKVIYLRRNSNAIGHWFIAEN